jgi:hypothetical protein
MFRNKTLNIFPDPSNAPPPYSMPFSSPPPRYVSVIGLNEQPNTKSTTTTQGEQPRKNKKVSKCPKVSIETNGIGISIGIGGIGESGTDLDSGLPTYNEALNRADEPVTTQAVIEQTNMSNTAIRISIV